MCVYYYLRVHSPSCSLVLLENWDATFFKKSSQKTAADEKSPENVFAFTEEIETLPIFINDIVNIENRDQTAISSRTRCCRPGRERFTIFRAVIFRMPQKKQLLFLVTNLRLGTKIWLFTTIQSPYPDEIGISPFRKGGWSRCTGPGGFATIMIAPGLYPGADHMRGLSPRGFPS